MPKTQPILQMFSALKGSSRRALTIWNLHTQLDSHMPSCVLPIPQNRSLIGMMHPEVGMNQSRFAGADFPKNVVNFARLQSQVDSVICNE